jgi:hypothetical protein
MHLSMHVSENTSTYINNIELYGEVWEHLGLIYDEFHEDGVKFG